MHKINIDPGIALPPNGIVKAALMTRFLAAERIERIARERAEEEMRRMRATIEAERAAARRAGYAAGLDAFALAIRKVDQVGKQVSDRVEALLRECLEHILGSMPREELLAATLASVLGNLRQGIDVLIMVHPGAMPALEQTLALHRENRNAAIFIRTEANPRMPPEECLIYAGSDVIDASIPVMIEEMLGALTLLAGSEVPHAA
ncbi:flagellar biosynthesis/type III secretory pathway protein FliH [Bradyrhizobium sp. USDA 4524]|uniref:hypothetical protein n=1 Tax=unclassified Bradyrhizobium TaxID=2631580 RepID=UPI0020A0C20D|nr:MULTISPECIES: hypothetical protein [unclassified Bradyrhizobium]MCP1846092.1 flagellar biosynthesis/type III secretory pathway protein FliH [Bradyrhizobium sp. USDA 4538]MCP1907274.1 flagellar biosynthesis/type III secretory pathway protein FliH [Bradyrhizobium sp. USDA 4537]MCP1985749.1 flagellar biosynthesis/type III secretory pathway protein FliH [Bradyrhizobium sp. USDA 4539]